MFDASELLVGPVVGSTIGSKPSPMGHIPMGEESNDDDGDRAALEAVGVVYGP